MRKHSFTLLEMLVSIGIIMVLAAIVYGGLSYASARAQEAKTIATMEQFISALEAFKQDYGYYPIVSSSPTQVNLSNSDWNLFMNNGSTNKRNRAYMEGELGELLDAYGKCFWYRYPGSNNTSKYEVWSMGADKQHGKKNGDDDSHANHAGESDSDDICSWKQY